MSIDAQPYMLSFCFIGSLLDKSLEPLFNARDQVIAIAPWFPLGMQPSFSPTPVLVIKFEILRRLLLGMRPSSPPPAPVIRYEILRQVR
jgi:hypothetical protein